MGRGFKVYVVASPLLQGQHQGGDVVSRVLFARPEVAYVVVLAEDAAQVAACKEYGSRTVPAYKRTFLSEERAERGDHGTVTYPAEAFLSLKPHGPTVPGTQPAG